MNSHFFFASKPAFGSSCLSYVKIRGKLHLSKSKLPLLLHIRVTTQPTMQIHMSEFPTLNGRSKLSILFLWTTRKFRRCLGSLTSQPAVRLLVSTVRTIILISRPDQSTQEWITGATGQNYTYYVLSTTYYFRHRALIPS